jgi:hypothetical protein
LQNWGATVPPTPSGWVNWVPTDGSVNQDDLDGVLQNWGNGTPPVAATAVVPEPTTPTHALAQLWLVASMRRERI